MSPIGEQDTFGLSAMVGAGKRLTVEHDGYRSTMGGTSNGGTVEVTKNGATLLEKELKAGESVEYLDIDGNRSLFAGGNDEAEVKSVLAAIENRNLPVVDKDY